MTGHVGRWQNAPAAVSLGEELMRLTDTLLGSPVAVVSVGGVGLLLLSTVVLSAAGGNVRRDAAEGDTRAMSVRTMSVVVGAIVAVVVVAAVVYVGVVTT